MPIGTVLNVKGGNSHACHQLREGDHAMEQASTPNTGGVGPDDECSQW